MSAQTGHTPTKHFCPGPKTGLCADAVLTSRFARMFWFTRLISRQNASEQTAWRDSRGVGRCESGSEDTDQSKSRCPLGAPLFLRNTPHGPGVLSKVKQTVGMGPWNRRLALGSLKWPRSVLRNIRTGSVLLEHSL